MVHWVVIIRPPIIVPDAEVVMYRLYLALIKNPFFQQRAGRALCTECHEKFLEETFGGARPDEVAKCRGMYNARKSIQFLVELPSRLPNSSNTSCAGVSRKSCHGCA